MTFCPGQPAGSLPGPDAVPVLCLGCSLVAPARCWSHDPVSSRRDGLRGDPHRPAVQRSCKAHSRDQKVSRPPSPGRSPRFWRRRFQLRASLHPTGFGTGAGVRREPWRTPPCDQSMPGRAARWGRTARLTTSARRGSRHSFQLADPWRSAWSTKLSTERTPQHTRVNNGPTLPARDPRSPSRPIACVLLAPAGGRSSSCGAGSCFCCQPVKVAVPWTGPAPVAAPTVLVVSVPVACPLGVVVPVVGGVCASGSCRGRKPSPAT